jgi:hypothetical protein
MKYSLQQQKFKYQFEANPTKVWALFLGDKAAQA